MYFFKKITTLLISVLTVIETPIIFFGFTDDLSCDYCDMVMIQKFVYFVQMRNVLLDVLTLKEHVMSIFCRAV